MIATELRIGNFIQYDRSASGKKEIFSIKEIDDFDGVKGLNFVESGGSVHSRSLQHFIEPIPLTVEWFAKFGVMKVYEYNSADTVRMGLNPDKPFTDFSFDSKPTRLVIISGVNYEVKYVHQLQNLCFALTGKELTLKK